MLGPPVFIDRNELVQTKISFVAFGFGDGLSSGHVEASNIAIAGDQASVA
jgi:hypothetical protein